MVTKGIITSIDFNGNTCQVRIPLFETAGNDPITGTAIVSNTPGSYNGYKVGDVVLVAFEDGKMQNPVIVGKLYLGAAKEKQDPRGTINVETTTASKSASLPADAVLTANVDSNVPNTNTPFGSLASIANNLNSLNTDVNQLDRFTRNQFNSVITDVNNQGEQLRSEIKQTASNIEANVVHTHKDGSQDALGWDLTTDSWKINAQDTVNGKVKDINIVTIDRSGMSIAGDLKLSGYPRNITALYAQTGSSENYPTPLYNFTEAEFPTPFPSGDEDKDKTWYYGKYIKITEAGEEKYILVFKENFEYYSITVGTTKAYNREVNSKVWSTETPKRVDGQYIWQWTHTEIYSFDGDKWDEQDDDKVVCITGAKGENGGTGKDGYTTVTVMLYKRSKTSISDNPIRDDLYYKFSDQKLYKDNAFNEEYKLPTGWSYTINGAGSSSNGDLYCIAAIAHSNTDSDSIPTSEWVGPTLYVENGEPTITLTIKNDFDSVPCDFDGNPSYSAQDWKDNTSHTIQVLEGQTPQAFNVIDSSSDEQIPSTGYAVVYKPDNSITYRVDNTDPFTAHIEGLTTDSANVLYTLYKNGTAIDEARFAATKLKAGAPGDPAVDYDILFSSSTIKVSKTGDKNPRTININFKKTVGQAEPVDFSGTYKVFVDNGTKPASYGTADSIVLATSGAADQQIDVSSAKSSVIVELYTADGNTKLEGETIDVVADGTDGTSVAQLILYKRTTETISSPADDGTWTYNAADGSLTCSDKSTEWKTGIPSGTEPCYESHAAVLITGLGTTTVTTWSEPAKFVENGAPGIGVTSLKTYYLMQSPTAASPEAPTQGQSVPSDSNWKETPDVYIDGYVYWLTTQTIYSDGRISYSDPVKDNGLDGVYEIAQGKSKNYYGDVDPASNDTGKAKMHKGDGWFDTAYHKIDKPTTSTGYLQKYIKEQNTGKYILITSQNIAEYISGSDPAKWPDAYSGPTLYQWSDNGKAGQWKDVGGELIANKVTANYINALDITTKKITVLDKSNNNKPLFEADGINGTGNVSIANFTVKNDKLYSGEHDEIGSTKAGIYLGSKGLSIGSNFKITTGVDGTDPKIAIAGYTKSVEKKYCRVGFAVVTANNKPDWWDDWNDANWSDTPPDRQDGSYIWEWTKTTSTTDADNDNTKDTKVCITGAKGDPGKDGTDGLIPSIGQNGNWWIGENDTGIKAEGLDGHTPEVTIGENGNWYIDGNDTGVLAKGTPGDPGKTGRSVLNVTKFYKMATSEPNPPDVKEPTDWYTSPPAFVKGNNYYESDRTIYDSVDSTGKDYSWSKVVENSMMTVDFIDSLGITAKKITVKRDNSKEQSNSKPNPILFEADSLSENGTVQIAEFTVGNNAQSSMGGPYIRYGGDSADNSILLSPGYNTVKQSLTGDNDVRTWTITSGQNFGVTSNGDLYANSAHIKGDLRTTGYNIGDNSGIWISSAGVTSTTSVGGSPSGTSNTWTIASGDDFGVTSDGKIFTRYGKIGALELTPTALKAGQRFSDSGDYSFLHINTDKNYAPTGWNDYAESAYSTLEASSARFNVQILGIERDKINSVDTVIYMDGRNKDEGGLVTTYQTHLSDQDNNRVCGRIPMSCFDKIPISIGDSQSPYIIPGPKNWNNKTYAPVRIILSGEKKNPATDMWYDMSLFCESHGIIIIDGVATSAIAKASNTNLSGYKQIATAYYENHDLRKFTRGELESSSQIPYSSLWVGNDGDEGTVDKISFIVTGWAVSEKVR